MKNKTLVFLGSFLVLHSLSGMERGGLNGKGKESAPKKFTAQRPGFVVGLLNWWYGANEANTWYYGVGGEIYDLNSLIENAHHNIWYLQDLANKGLDLNDESYNNAWDHAQRSLVHAENHEELHSDIYKMDRVEKLRAHYNKLSLKRAPSQPFTVSGPVRTQRAGEAQPAIQKPAVPAPLAAPVIVAPSAPVASGSQHRQVVESNVDRVIKKAHNVLVELKTLSTWNAIKDKLERVELSLSNLWSQPKTDKQEQEVKRLQSSIAAIRTEWEERKYKDKK